MHPSLQSTFVVIASCNRTYQGTLVAVFFAASQGLALSRLIVARAMPIASRAFATVAIRRSVGGAAVVATMIVVDTTTTMDPVSAVGNVVALIAAKSNLEPFFFAQFFDCHRLLRYDIKRSLIAVASCDMTSKKSSLSLLLSRMTIKSFTYRDTTAKNINVVASPRTKICSCERWHKSQMVA